MATPTPPPSLERQPFTLHRPKRTTSPLVVIPAMIGLLVGGLIVVRGCSQRMTMQDRKDEIMKQYRESDGQ